MAVNSPAITFLNITDPFDNSGHFEVSVIGGNEHKANTSNKEEADGWNCHGFQQGPTGTA